MYLKTLSLAEIHPYERNPRINEKAVEPVMKSIEKDGYRARIIVDKEGTIIAGHTRYEAMKRLGWTDVEVWIADDMTPEQIADYRIRDNLTADFAEWDFSELEAEIAEMDLDFDMSEFEGFEDLHGGVSDMSTAEEDDFDEDTPIEPTAKLGDIYQLGQHRLMCGDSTDINAVECLMDGTKARMVFTDPPWNVNYGAEEEGNAMGYKPRTILNDFMGTEEFKQFMNSAFHCMSAVSEPGCMTYVVMSAQEWGNMMLTLAGNNYHWSSTIIWNKDQLVLSRKDYHTKYEPIWYGWKEGAARLHPLDDRKQCDVWDYDRPKVSVEHPTMKPVALVAQAINNSSKSGDPVLDLFGGSGTTLIASEQLGRRCYMMELDPHYVDVIIARWENLTGKKAVLLNG